MRLLLALALTSRLAAADFESWVRAQNGSVERADDGRIVAVNLAHSWITDADLARVAALGRLERLDLSGARISDLGLEALKPLQGVRELKLRFAEFVSEGGVAHLLAWKDLETLDLRGTQVRSLVFDRLPSFPRLQRLDLSHTRITDEGFDRLADLPELHELAIGSNRLDGAALDHLKLLPKLRALDVSGVQRVDSGIWGLALNPANLRRLGELVQLERLDLRGATITDVGSDRPGRPDAERTSLPGLGALANLRNLRWLDLSRQPVSPADLAFLAQLPQLRTLRLGQCVAIDDSAAALLAQLPELRELYIAGSGMTGAGLAQLAESPMLERIGAGGAEMSLEAISAFRTARPGVRLDWFAGSFLRERRIAQ